MRVLMTIFVAALFLVALVLAVQGRFALALALSVFSAAVPLFTARRRNRQLR